MNKFINILLGMVGIITMLVAILVGFDVPLNILHTTGANILYVDYILLGLGILILVLNLRRSVRRWTGMRIVNQLQRYKWNEPMSQERKSRVNTYLLIEAVVMISFAVGLYMVTPRAWMPTAALLFGGIDSIIFALYGVRKNKFRVGLTSKAIVIADRDVKVIYFTGLRKISRQQQTIYFDYIKDLQLSFPVDCIAEVNQKEFFKALSSEVNHEKVFISKHLSTN